MITVNNVGRISYLDNIQDGPGMRVAREFLNLLTIEFAKESAKYIKLTGEAPFAWSERQLISIIAPSLSKISKAFLAEHPICRKKFLRKDDNNDYTGYLDYWCRYGRAKKNGGIWDFFIEVKHSLDAFATDIITVETKDRWQNMNNVQLKMVKHAAKDFSENCNGVIPLALHVIPIFENVKRNHRPYSQDDNEVLLDILEKYHGSLKPSPNFSCIWILHEKLFTESAQEYSTQNTDYFPGVMLIAKVYEIIIKC